MSAGCRGLRVNLAVLAGTLRLLLATSVVLAQADSSGSATVDPGDNVPTVTLPDDSGPSVSPFKRKDVPFGAVAAGIPFGAAPAEATPCSSAPPPVEEAQVQVLDDVVIQIPSSASTLTVNTPDGAAVGEGSRLTRGKQSGVVYYTSPGDEPCAWQFWTWHTHVGDPLGSYAIVAAGDGDTFNNTFILGPRSELAVERRSSAVGPPGTSFSWGVAGISPSTALPLILYQSWADCISPRADIPPMRANYRGEAVYSIPTDADDNTTGRFVVASPGGRTLLSFSLIRSGDTPDSPAPAIQILETLQHSGCLWAWVAQNGRRSALPSVSPAAADGKGDIFPALADAPPPLLLNAGFGGKRLAELSAQLESLAARGQWEVVRVQQLPVIQTVRTLADGEIEAIVVEDRVDRVYDPDGSLAADRSGAVRERVVLDLDWRIVELTADREVDRMPPL
jgi:hypothetical protein